MQSKFVLTLTPVFLYCEFAFCAHFQCVVRTYCFKCVEKLESSRINVRQAHEYSFEMESVSALSNEISCLEKSILQCVDSVIGKSILKLEMCFIIIRKTICPFDWSFRALGTSRPSSPVR